LQAFKQMVRRQMYWTFGLTLAFWLVGLFTVSVLIMRLEFGMTRGVLFVLLFAIAEGTFLHKRRIRQQIFDMPASDKGIESLHQAVCLEWTRKTLPEF
jgi:FtsH-binding integral membrane protein